MLYEINFSAKDLQNIDSIDNVLQNKDLTDSWIQNFFIQSFFDLMNSLRNHRYALANPYNCGTLLKTENDTLLGIDLAMIENYYQGKDWQIPASLYDKLVDNLDILIVSHGHWDHCWIELMEYMIFKNKPVIIPEGMDTDRGKSVPDGCIEVADNENYDFRDLKLHFRFSKHAYDNGRNIRIMTTTVWDGYNNFLHTTDADTTNPHGFKWFDLHPTDILLFKFGGVSPYIDDYTEFENVVDIVNPRKLIIPIHLSELGHKGTDACRTYSQAYNWLGEFQRRGKLKNRKYAVLFGNRIVNLDNL